MIDISPPPPEEYEVRVIVWKTKEVVAMDEWTNMNDLFCKVIFEGQKPQVTDISASGKLFQQYWVVPAHADCHVRHHMPSCPTVTASTWKGAAANRSTPQRITPWTRSCRGLVSGGTRTSWSSM